MTEPTDAEPDAAFVTCLGCGRFVPRESMTEHVAEAGPYTDVDVSGIAGVSAAACRTVRVEYRCRECLSAPTEQETVQ